MALDASLLKINDLSNVLSQRGQQADQNWSNSMNAIGSLATSGVNAYDQQTINQALSNNFDQASGKLNQQGVIKDIYAYKPQLAQKMAQDYLSKDMNNQKMQSDINKTTAETGKLGAETGKVNAETGSLELKKMIDQNNQLGQLVIGANSQDSLNKVIEFAKSKGIDTSLYQGAEYSPQLKQQVMAQIIDANNQIKNQIDQQNANSGTMNALTAQQTSNQNYEVNSNKNTIDNRKANTDEAKTQAEILKINNDIATKGMLTPAQQLDFNKANNDLEKTKIETSNKIQTGINNLSKANKIIDLFSENAQKLLSSPLISSGIDPKTGKVLPNNNTDLGGIWGNLRSNDSTLNPFNKDSNEYKQFKAGWERLALQARGKALQDMKSLSADGSAGLGGTSDMEIKMLGAMQNIPDAETAFKMTPQERVDMLTGVIDAGKEDKTNNQGLIERAKSQGSVISKQAINAPQVRGGNIPQSMPQENYNVQVGAPLPPLRDKVFTASNGYVLTPAMAARIAKERGQ